MSCNCSSKTKCGCSTSCSTSCSSCDTTCAAVCTALEVANSWNIPACSAEAVLSVPGLETVLIGSYIYNPTYGWFQVTAFDSANHQITVMNECFDANAAAGTVVPALTTFIFSAPPSSTNVTYEQLAVGTPYDFTAVDAELVFGTTSPTITLTVPGTYLLMGSVSVQAAAVTTAGASSVACNFKRTNNTPALLGGTSVYMAGAQALTGASYVMGTGAIFPVIYTTSNSNDIITIYGKYLGSAPSSGDFQAVYAKITAVKLS